MKSPDDFAVDGGELDNATDTLREAANGLYGVKMEPPDISMYGSQVGGAAPDLEPATTEDINDLLVALNVTAAMLADRLAETRAQYAETEKGNQLMAQEAGKFGESP